MPRVDCTKLETYLVDQAHELGGLILQRAREVRREAEQLLEESEILEAKARQRLRYAVDLIGQAHGQKIPDDARAWRSNDLQVFEWENNGKEDTHAESDVDEPGEEVLGRGDAAGGERPAPLAGATASGG